MAVRRQGLFDLSIKKSLVFGFAFTMLLGQAHGTECKNISPFQAYQKASFLGFGFQCKGAFNADPQGGIGCFFAPEKKQRHFGEFFIDQRDDPNARNGQLRNGWRIKDYTLDCRLVFKNGQWVQPKGFKNCRKDARRAHRTVGKKTGPRLFFKTKPLRMDKKAKHWAYHITSLTFEKEGGTCSNVLKEAFEGD